MIPLQIRRILLAEHRVDFRKRFDGLLAEAYRLGANPYEGDCMVFISGDRTQLRVLVGDGIGLYLGCRRFEGGRLAATFRFVGEPCCHAITEGELSMLVEGASYSVHKRVKAWQK